MSVASLNNGSLQLSELTISNEKYSNATGYVASSSTFSSSTNSTSLATSNITLPNTVDCVLTSNVSGNLLVNGVPVGGGGGGAVDAVLGGDGISVVTVGGDATVTNDGVLALTAGTNITITGTNDNLTINSSGGGGGAVDSVIAGDGISVSGTTDVTVTNDGVLSIVAGDGISATTTGGVVTIANTAGSLPYVLGGKIFSFTGQTISAGIQYAFRLSLIPNITPNPNTIATLSLDESLGLPLLISIKWDAGSSFLTAYFYNYSDTDITANFNFSVIAMNY